MFELRKWLTLLTAILLVLFVMHQLWQIYKRQRRGPGIWYVFTAVTAIAALTLLVDNVSLWLDTLTELNNVSWYLGYSLGVISAGLVDCQMGNDGMYAKLARILAILTICVLLLMAFLYGFYMIDSSEWVPRDPRSWPEVIFAISFFFYDAMVTIITLYIAHQSIRLEHNPLVRMRLQIGNSCRYIAIVCFVAKLSYIVLEFTIGGYRWLNQLALVTMVIAALLWLTLVMPKRLYEWLIRHNPWTTYKQLRLLRELEGLQEQLLAIIPIADSYRYNQKLRLNTELQMIIYRVIIQILDCKKVMDGYLNATSEERQKNAEIAWSQEQWLSATRIHQALLPLNQLTGDSMQEVASALQIVARKLRTSA